MDHGTEFALVLRQAIQQTQRTYSTGLLSKLSRVPKMTIVNWLDGRVARPRSWYELVRVADALRMGEAETSRLLQSAGYPSIGELVATQVNPHERTLLATWTPIRRAAQQLRNVIGVQTATMPLFGRTDQVTKIGEAIAQRDGRAVVLVGPAGVGKTRLAQHSAAQLYHLFPDGVIWVSLANLGNHVEVLAAIVQACGVSGNGDLITLLATHLHDRRSLLVLDEYEHVATTRFLHALLDGALPVPMLITSRISLRNARINEIEIPPLPLPDGELLMSLAQQAVQPAVALFVARAQMVQPSFMLTTANVAAVTALCVQLDGLPLAIELMAARVKVASPQELLAHLNGQSGGVLELLVGGACDLPTRQRSMREAIAWSYARLPEDARSLFVRLAIMTNGQSFTAASVKLNVQARDRYLQLLTTLCEHHLLHVATVDGNARYSMLKTIRDYALEQTKNF